MHRGGLSVLLTTPITSVQIVLGKLLSRLWQILLLVALTLPALAVVRVMGGVSSELVVSSLCITLTAVLFVGALCLWLSTRCRYPYQVISSAAIIYLIVLIAVPGVVTLAFSLVGLSTSLAASISHLVSPRWAFNACFDQAWRRRPMGATYFFSWPVHCMLMLGATLGLLGVCARRLRRVTMRGLAVMSRRARQRRPLRRCPILWRERAANSSRLELGGLLLVILAALLCFLMVVGRVKLGRGYQLYSSAGDIAWAFWMVALLRLAVLAAGAIAREKEGGTWPLLLTTPCDEKRIIRSKLRAVVDRGAPWVLAALALHTCFFLCVGSLPDIQWVVVYVLCFCASAFFVVAAGLYFGVRLKTTTAAVAVTLGAHLCLRYLLGGNYNPLYIWLRYRIITGFQGSSTAMMLFGSGTLLTVAFLHVGLGWFLLRRAQRTLRGTV
jgi:ABC-type transport system involved in multi-copper enzyme maturation permease subunit